MAGYADLLAQVLNPDTASGNMWIHSGRALQQTQLPVMGKPWMTGLANALTGIVGGAMTGYGINQARQEQAAYAQDAIKMLGAELSPELKEGISSTNPSKRNLAILQLGSQMDADAAAKANALEMTNFMNKEGFKAGLQKDIELAKLDAEKPGKLFDLESQLRKEVNDNKQVQAYDKLVPIYDSMLSSYEAGGPRATLDLIWGTAKLLDETGSVREGDVSTLSSLGGYGSYLTKIINDMKDGSIPQNVADELLATSASRIKGLKATVDPLLEGYNKRATQLGIDPAHLRFSRGLSEDQLGAPQSQIERDIKATANEMGVPVELAMQVALQESGLKPNATSPKGAQGIFQLMPGTAKDVGVTNPLDPKQNIRGGITYLKQLLTKYNNNVPMALAAYNAGMGTVDQVGGIPNFDETLGYVGNIMGQLKMQDQVPPGYALQQNKATGKFRLVKAEG